MDGRVIEDDDVVAQLADANFVEFAREQARWSGPLGSIVERHGVGMVASGSPFPVGANGVVRLDPTVPADEALDLAEEWFGAMGRGYAVSTNSHRGDADIAAAAEARGLLQVMDTPAMVRDARVEDRPAPEGIELRVLDDETGVADFVAINDAAYQSLGMPAGVIVDTVRVPERVLAPHFRTVVAYDGATPLATAQVLLSHGIAGVYWVGTVEAARGRGLADLVTRTVTNLAFDLGAAFVTLQASSMGEPIYRRMGYREIYRYTAFARFV